MRFLVNLSEKHMLENAGDRVPIGLLSIAANNPNTKVYDLNHMSQNDFFKEVDKYKPESVGVSVYTSPQLNQAREIGNYLKNKTHLIAGGHHASAMPKSLIDTYNSVVIGEGEIMFDLASRFNGIFSGEPNLDKLKNPDRSLLNMNNYGIDQDGKRTATLISSRGCYWDCSFCGKIPNSVRYESLDKMKEQIDSVKNEGFDSVYFLDDIFTVNEKRMIPIIEYMKKKDLPFRVTTRANLLNDSKLEKLAKNGCKWLSMGIESGDDEILGKSNKGMNTSQNYDAVRMATENGIKTKGFFIIGLPGETEETAKRTIEFSQSLKNSGLTSADFYYLTPLPGTPIWKNPEKFGIEIIDKDYTKYLQAGKNAKCVINTENLKSERIEELVNEAKELWKS